MTKENREDFNRSFVSAVFDEEDQRGFTEAGTTTGVSVEIVSVAGEQYTTKDGYTYTLAEGRVSLVLRNTNKDSNFEPFWEKVADLRRVQSTD